MDSTSVIWKAMPGEVLRI